MRAERLLLHPHWVLALLCLGGLRPVAAQETALDPPLCEYQNLIQVTPDTGDIHLSRQKVGENECAEIGAAVAEMPNAWRRRLPPRVRWEQRADATELCQRPQTELGQRLASQLAPHGCVFLKPQEVCTIVSGAALSHAQLANAVRECAP